MPSGYHSFLVLEVVLIRKKRLSSYHILLSNLKGRGKNYKILSNEYYIITNFH